MKPVKTKAIAIIIILFILGAGGASFLFLRGKKENIFSNQQNPSSQEKITEKFLNSSDEELKEIAKNKQKFPPSLTSLEKIDSSFQEGKIDVNKCLKLKVLALFSPQDLPSEFQSQTYKKGEGDMLLVEIRERQNQLNEKTKEILSPFILLPEDEKSFFNPKADTDNILKKVKESL